MKFDLALALIALAIAVATFYRVHTMKKRLSRHEAIRKSKPPVFVFGSNMRGAHAGGAAAWAVEHRGAIWGKAIGMQGNSYAIPSLDAYMQQLPLNNIRWFVEGFLIFACRYPKMTFQVTPIGCGIAGFKHSDIAPMFRGAPPNCIMPPEWAKYL